MSSPVKNRIKRLGRDLLLALILLLLIAFDARLQLHSPLNAEKPTTVELESRQSLGSLFRQMDEQGLFASTRQRLYLLAYARLRKGAPAKAGEYAIEPGLTPLELLRLLGSGKVVEHELRLVEGWRFAQAWKAIQADPNLNHTLNDADGAAVAQALGLNGQSPESILFPDTYRFPKHTTDLALLKLAHAELSRVLNEEWASRAPNLPYSGPEQALIMASLVEKETGLASERPQIAGVFVRRLEQGMKLQTDPAVIYGMGETYTGNIRSADLRADTPYNTYTRAGLPPTPICLPGRESIHAALHPDNSKALYFVSKGNGSHQFSDSLDEHNAAVMQYQIRPHLHP